MKPVSKNFRHIAIACLCVLAMAGCSNMTRQQQRVLSGAAIGTGVGAAAGALTGGNAVTGAAIGAAAGAGGGYLYDKSH
jgi:hypothetical protein